MFIFEKIYTQGFPLKFLFSWQLLLYQVRNESGKAAGEKESVHILTKDNLCNSEVRACNSQKHGIQINKD